MAAGYTRPARIAILDTSNGGTVVGAAMTQRPDLFGVALPVARDGDSFMENAADWLTFTMRQFGMTLGER